MNSDQVNITGEPGGAPVTPTTIAVPTPAAPACLDEATAFRLANDSGKVAGIVSASEISCIAPDVALGTLTDSIGEGLYSMWQLRDGTWTWVVATYGVHAVCEAVARLYPAIDVGCGTQPVVDGLTIAKCVSLDMMYVGMTGHRDEVALLQTTLHNMGLDPGKIDGYFGGNTFAAAAQSQDAFADGTSGGNGVFADELSILAIVFQRLGIAC